MLLNPNAGRAIRGAMYEENFLKKTNFGGRLNLTNGQNAGNMAQYSGAYPAAPSLVMQRNGIWQATNNISQYRISDLGMCIERGHINALLWTRDLTNAAWVKTGVPVVLKNQIGNDTLSIAAGTSSASSITAGGVDDTVIQTVTLTSRPIIGHANVKRLVGSGQISMTQDAGANWTDITSQIPASGYGWIQLPMTTLTNPGLGFKINVIGDSIAVDLTDIEYINGTVSGFTALQTGSLATSPVVNTTAVNSRANENEFFQNTNAIGSIWSAGVTLLNDLFSKSGAFSVVASWNGDVTTGGSANSGPLFLASDMVCPTSIGGGATDGFGTGTAKTANTGFNGRGNWNCAAFSIDGSGLRTCLNGGLVAGPLATNPTWLPNANAGCTHFNMFNNGSGNVNGPLNGFSGGRSFIRRRLSDMEMQYYTDLSNGYFTTYL